MFRRIIRIRMDHLILLTLTDIAAGDNIEPVTFVDEFEGFVDAVLDADEEVLRATGAVWGCEELDVGFEDVEE